MGKSLGNGVDLGEQMGVYGVDAIRLTMIFASPPQDDIDWADVNPDAMVKFLGRVWRIAADVAAAGARGVPRPPRAAGGVSRGGRGLRQVTHPVLNEVNPPGENHP